MDMDFAITSPLVRHRMPHIWFLFIGSRLCSALLSDHASQRRPCASLSLLLHQDGKRTFTSKLSNMLGTPQKSRSAFAPAIETQLLTTEEGWALEIHLAAHHSKRAEETGAEQDHGAGFRRGTGDGNLSRAQLGNGKVASREIGDHDAGDVLIGLRSK